MKTVNSKFIVLGLATVLITACSDSSNNENNAGLQMNTNLVGSAVVSQTDAQALAARVTNYKGIYATDNTQSRALSSIIEMSEPTVPSDAIKLSSITDKEWEAHPGTYVIEDGETVNGDSRDIGNMTIYIKKGGKFIYGGAYTDKDAPNSTIYIMKGGTLTAKNNPEIVGDTKIYNWGTIEYPKDQQTYTIKNDFYNYTGSLDITGKKLIVENSATMFINGTLTAKEVEIIGPKTDDEEKKEEAQSHSTELTPTQLYCKENANVDELFYLTNIAEAWVNGNLTAGKLDLDGKAKLTSGCATKITGDVYLTNGTHTYIRYLKAANLKKDSGAMLYVSNQGMVDVAGDFEELNNGKGYVDVPDANGVAAFRAKKFIYNAPGKEGDWSPKGAKTIICDLFSTSGENAHIVIEATEGVYSNANSDVKVTDDNTTIIWNKNANVHWYKDEDAKNYVVKATECNPSGYNDDPSTPDKKPTLDLITSIDYDNHEHDISATCIQPYNGKMYMSYHTRGTEHGGCLEVFSPVQDNKVTLNQYLYDSDKDLDYNHLIINNGNLYTVGSSNKKGAMLAYIKIATGGLLNTQSTTTTDENGKTKEEQPLNILPLLKATSNNSGNDENCIAYDDAANRYIVMTTKGYTTYNATSLEETAFIEKQGKAKHIAIDGNKIATLVLDKKASTVDEAINATVEIFDKGADLTQASKSFSVPAIQPNNGKNVLTIKNNKIYVCLSAAGIYCYDMDGNEQWHYQMPSPINAAGAYKAYANGCFVGDDGKVYVAYGSYGLVVLDSEGNVIAQRKTPKSANYVVEYNGYIYVAYGQSRLQVFKLHE